MEVVVLLLILAIGLMVYYIKRGKARSLVLPGPKGLPILQNLAVFAKELPVNQMLKWRQTYGAIYKLRVLGQDLVVLADYDSVYEALVTRGRACADRSRVYRDRLLFKNSGVSRSEYGPKLIESKKHIHRNVRHYGKGVPKIESIIREVADEMFQEFRETNGQAFDPRASILGAARRVMYTLVVGGKPSPQGDRVMDSLKHMETEVPSLLAFISNGLLLDAFPWLRHFGWRLYKDILNVRNCLDEAWLTLKDKLKSDEENSGLAKSMIDFHDFQKGSSLLSETDIQMTCVSTYTAGVLTTSTSFYTLINILAHHPDIQERIFDEVNCRISGERHASLLDRPNMPYTQALLLELLRYVTVAPIGVIHKTLKDTQIQGHALPKGTSLLPYLWGVHHDEQFWGDPWNFRPERFLDGEKNLVPADHPNRRHIMAFGAGPRRCPGETLAMARLFLWTVDLVRSFRVQPSDNADIASCDGRNFTILVLLLVPSFKAKFLPRGITPA